jgi:hypothetical protein
LDLFWSREAGTVRNVVGSIKEVVRRSKDQGWLRPPVEPMTPWPLADGEGMGVAILMLEKSLEPGRNSKTYQHLIPSESCYQLSQMYTVLQLGDARNP